MNFLAADSDVSSVHEGFDLHSSRQSNWRQWSSEYREQWTIIANTARSSVSFQINFEKLRMIAKEIRHIINMASSPYVGECRSSSKCTCVFVCLVRIYPTCSILLHRIHTSLPVSVINRRSSRREPFDVIRRTCVFPWPPTPNESMTK